MAEGTGLQAQLTSVRTRRALRRALTAGPGDLEAIQVRRLKAVVEAARSTEPYRRIYGDGIGTRIEDITDLSRLPIVDRAHLGSFPLESRMAAQPERTIRHSTSGTTGEPIQIPAKTVVKFTVAKALKDLIKK